VSAPGKPTVRCATHGESEAAFICDHSLASLTDGVPRGLHLWLNEKGSTCGWCDACDAKVGARVKNRNLPRVQFKVFTLCETCFRPLKVLNNGGVWDR